MLVFPRRATEIIVRCTSGLITSLPPPPRFRVRLSLSPWKFKEVAVNELIFPQLFFSSAN